LFEADPGAGHETTLQIIKLGERLGFDSAWLRNRQLQYGISSPVAVLAAATQRTSSIELGTAVIPLTWENPLRLAEDLATVDRLSGAARASQGGAPDRLGVGFPTREVRSLCGGAHAADEVAAEPGEAAVRGRPAGHERGDR
jgi:hypothetical protein